MTSVQELTATDRALTDVIRAWLRLGISGDEGLVGQTTDMAMSYRADGARVDETGAWARVLLPSWLHHPPHGSSGGHLTVAGASGSS